jgi:hypothetical protein
VSADSETTKERGVTGVRRSVRAEGVGLEVSSGSAPAMGERVGRRTYFSAGPGLCVKMALRT